MKKLFIAIALAALCASLVACNKQMMDLTYEYDYAIIQLPDGTTISGKVQSWSDYDGEQLQIKIDGKIYLVSSYNSVLINTNGSEVQ